MPMSRAACLVGIALWIASGAAAAQERVEG
jgi:hypothetical protein